MVMKVIDLSNNKPGYNLKSLGADAYIFKATEGNYFVDKTCDPYIQQCLKAKKPFGVYHFIDNRSGWKAQADFFLKNVKGYIKKGLLIVDYEMYGRIGTAKLKSWLDYVYKKTGVKPVVYTSASVLFEENFSAIVKADYGLWVAAYQSKFPAIKYWKSALGWQYTSSPYDQSIFYIDKTAWNRVANPSTKAKVETKVSKNNFNSKKLPCYLKATKDLRIYKKPGATKENETKGLLKKGSIFYGKKGAVTGNGNLRIDMGTGYVIGYTDRVKKV